MSPLLSLSSVKKVEEEKEAGKKKIVAPPGQHKSGNGGLGTLHDTISALR